MSDTLRLEDERGEASAILALRGAEPVSWRVRGRELLWHADPAHWERSAPILFPVVGASADGVIRVGARSYPMPQHGFARDALFTLVERTGSSARLRLTESETSLAHYPFPFALEVEAKLTADTLSLGFEVANPGREELPFSLGFHPAFPWPFEGRSREEHAVEFEAEEDPTIPDVAPGALLRPGRGRVPLQGRRLALDPALFTEALCFLNARSRGLRFVAPSDSAVAMEVQNFAHLALWTKPDAPFLSMEAWTGHADWEGFSGELGDRASITRLAPGRSAHHAVRLTWQPAGN